MFQHEMVAEPWLSFLRYLDELATTDVRVDCIRWICRRTTGDIDVLEIAPKSAADAFAKVASEGGKLHQKYKVYLDRVGVAQPPYNYASRLHEMFPGVFRHLRLMALDPYDLALTKLERNIEKDRGDVRYLARTIPFDLNVLRERYASELRPYLGNPTREDLSFRFWIEDIEEDRKSHS